MVAVSLQNRQADLVLAVGLRNVTVVHVRVVNTADPDQAVRVPGVIEAVLAPITVVPDLVLVLIIREVALVLEVIQVTDADLDGVVSEEDLMTGGPIINHVSKIQEITQEAEVAVIIIIVIPDIMIEIFEAVAVDHIIITAGVVVDLGVDSKGVVTGIIGIAGMIGVAHVIVAGHTVEVEKENQKML